MKTMEKLIEMNRNESPTLPHPSGIQTQPHKFFKELGGEKKKNTVVIPVFCCRLGESHLRG